MISPFIHRGDLNGDDAQTADKEGHQRVSLYYGTNEEAPCCGISTLPRLGFVVANESDPTIHLQ